MRLWRRQQAQEAQTVQVVSSPIWKPEPQQALARNSQAFETLYGGAAGGGKSDLLLGLAVLDHQHSLLLRRTYPELEDSLILRSRELYASVGSYNGSQRRWRIGNKRVRFGHLEYEKHVRIYLSAAFDFIGFDELTQFTKFQYEFLLSRARTVRRGQRVRIVGATNPGGEGIAWVMERWAAWLDENYPDPAEPGELRWFKRGPDDSWLECGPDDPDAMSRTYIPAKLSDNPYLGEEYRKTLNLLPEPYRSQLLDGNWQAGQEDDAYQVIPTAWIKAAQARWRPDGGPDGCGQLSVVGVDVARGGKDKTVLAARHGNWYARLRKYPGRTTQDGPEVVALFAPLLTEGGSAAVDVIGVGSSVYDTAVGAGLTVESVNFAEGTKERDTTDSYGFTNKRAEYYWRMREALDPRSGQDIALPPDPELLGDLRAIRWKMQSNGIRIESKPEIVKRLGRSPDCGDAVVLALVEPSVLMIALWDE